MATKIFTIPDIGEVHISKRKGQRTIRISVANSVVRVTQPTWLPFSAGEAFANSKTDWITEHLRPQTLYVDGQRIGITHTLKLSRGHKLSKRVTPNTVLITYRGHDEFSSADVQAYISAAIQKVLRTQAEHYLPERTQQLADMCGFTFSSVSIRQLKRRWGSCNSKKEITYNYKLMELDTLHIDYVILHELTHTLHMNHGEAFWAHMETVMPNSKKIAKAVRHLQV